MKTKKSLLIRLMSTSFALACVLCWRPAMVGAQANEQTLKSFGGNVYQDGQNPTGTLLDIGDGALYGATAAGGENGAGALFKLNLDGTGYVMLYQFGSSNGDGSGPEAALVHGADGALYGTTIRGGTNGYGTVFKIKPDGSGFAVLHAFAWPGGDDGTSTVFKYTAATLVQGHDGILYGTALSSSPVHTNIVFKLNADGTGFQVLYSLEPPDGIQVQPALLQGADGALYGVTQSGGIYSALGTVFKLKPDGSGFVLLHRFEGTSDGAHPQAALIQGVDGALYGTTGAGGTYGLGTVFKINPNGTGYQVLHSLEGPGIYGTGYQEGVVQGADGSFYGVTFGGGNAAGYVFRLNPADNRFEKLHNFGAEPKDGVNPSAALVQNASGALYGTTSNGGTNGFGTLFKIDPSGSNYMVLHSFGQTISAASGPQAALAQGPDGALYGATAAGGTNGLGALFTLGPDGTGYRVLRSFAGSPDDGAKPQAALMPGFDGAYYGTTFAGGTSNAGTVFRINPDGGGYRILHSFGVSRGDGAQPQAALTPGPDSSLYGTTTSGGANGAGTLFKLNLDGADYTLMHGFRSSSLDAANPRAALVLGPGGAFYGTTDLGGSNNQGTVFRINPDGAGYNVIHSFGASRGDGARPQAALTPGLDGSLYGVTVSGGTNDEGTVFKLNPDGTDYKLLHSFSSRRADGAHPQSALVLGADGSFYGATTSGGVDEGLSSGTVFRINPDGTGYTVIYGFGASSDDGMAPQAALLQGLDGAFYGTTSRGGSRGGGTVFRVTKTPWAPQPPFVISIVPLIDGSFHLSFDGITGLTYRLEASTNLLDWVTLGTILNEAGPVQFLDWNVSKNQRRFYRAVYTR